MQRERRVTSRREGLILSCPVSDISRVARLGCSLIVHRLANLADLWETVGMTNQQTNQPTDQQQRSQHREDHKLQKLMKRVEMKLALQAKATRDASQESSKN
jgi:hypothetical protein